MREVNRMLTANGIKVGVVISRFNSFLTEQLLKGAIDAFTRLGGDEKNLTVVRVPGAYELPLVAKRHGARLDNRLGGDAVPAEPLFFLVTNKRAIQSDAILVRTYYSKNHISLRCAVFA